MTGVPTHESSAANDWLRVAEAAAHVGLSVSTMNKLRLYGGGPRFSRAGKKIIVYGRGDLDEWLNCRMRTSTSDPGGLSQVRPIGPRARFGR